MRIGLSIIIILFLAACSSGNVPSDVIQPEKMKLVVYDMIRADEWVNTRASADTSFNRTTEVRKFYEQVFLIHKITRKQFYDSYKYYQAHPDLNRTLFDSLQGYANKKKLIVDTMSK